MKILAPPETRAERSSLRLGRPDCVGDVCPLGEEAGWSLLAPYEDCGGEGGKSVEEDGVRDEEMKRMDESKGKNGA